MFLFRLIARLPFPLLYFLSDIICLLAFRMAGYRKTVIRTNLRKSFPEKSDSAIRVITRQFYRNLADVIVETIKSLHIRAEELKRRVAVKNLEVLTDYLNNGQPVLVMTAHQANWEWLQLVHAILLNGAADAVYKPLHNQFFNQLMLAIRTRFGSYPLPSPQISRELVKRKSVVRVVAMVADQSPSPEAAYWTTFLNQDTPFFTGAAKIARRTNYPVLYVHMQRTRRGYYEVWFTELYKQPGLLTDEQQITERYAREVERAIRERPAEWLWSHKRWKHAAKRPEMEEKMN